MTIEPVKFNHATINLREDILDSAAMTGSETSFQSPSGTASGQGSLAPVGMLIRDQ